MLKYISGSISSTIKTFINVPLLTKPGSTYNYNNGNTIVLSYFVEKFSGLKLEEYMRKNIFNPFGFSGTSQDSLAQQLKANSNKANEYYDYTDLSQSFTYFAYGNGAATEVQQGVQSGAGGFLSTAADLIKFYTSMFVSKNVSHIISDESLAMMIEPVSITQNSSVYGVNVLAWGYSWFINPLVP